MGGRGEDSRVNVGQLLGDRDEEEDAVGRAMCCHFIFIMAAKKST